LFSCPPSGGRPRPDGRSDAAFHLDQQCTGLGRGADQTTSTRLCCTTNSSFNGRRWCSPPRPPNLKSPATKLWRVLPSDVGPLVVVRPIPRPRVGRGRNPAPCALFGVHATARGDADGLSRTAGNNPQTPARNPRVLYLKFLKKNYSYSRLRGEVQGAGDSRSWVPRLEGLTSPSSTATMHAYLPIRSIHRTQWPMLRVVAIQAWSIRTRACDARTSPPRDLAGVEFSPAGINRCPPRIPGRPIGCCGRHQITPAGSALSRSTGRRALTLIRLMALFACRRLSPVACNNRRPLSGVTGQHSLQLV